MKSLAQKRLKHWNAAVSVDEKRTPTSVQVLL